MTNQQTLPPLDQILSDAGDSPDEAAARTQAELIDRALVDLGILADVRNVHYGPRLTQFSLKPHGQGQVSDIIKAETDLAVALSGRLAQIEAPAPGYPYVRLIVENQGRPNVTLRRVIETPAFRQVEGAVKVGLGVDTFGRPVVIDLAALPHLLIGGATGSGKSVCLNAITAGLLCAYRPEAVQLLLIDPVRVELDQFEGLPHLAAPLVSRPGRALEALTGVLGEIERRYTHFSKVQARDVAGYNRQAAHTGQPPLPYLVVLIDNLVDLLLAASKDLEQVLARIAQKGRGAGIHLVLASHRANVGAISGVIKANFPGRIAFRTADRAESQQILDLGGAERLLGQGDMLYKPPHTSILQRIQSVYVPEVELRRIIDFWQKQK